MQTAANWKFPVVRKCFPKDLLFNLLSFQLELRSRKSCKCVKCQGIKKIILICFLFNLGNQ